MEGAAICGAFSEKLSKFARAAWLRTWRSQSSRAGRASKRERFRLATSEPLFFLLAVYSADVSVSRSASPALGDAMQRCELKLVPVEGDQLDELLSRRLDLAAATIPGGLYIGALDDVPAFGLRAVLATTVNVDDGLVRQVTGAILDSMAKFSGQHPVLATVGAGGGTMISAGISLPLHPGAEAAYRARGMLPTE